MIKKTLIAIGLSTNIIGTIAYAAYTVGVCYKANNQWTMQYVCFTNPGWGSPLWVKQTADPGPGSWPSTLCQKDTGAVFNSTNTVLQECTNIDNGQYIQYKNFNGPIKI